VGTRSFKLVFKIEMASLKKPYGGEFYKTLSTYAFF